MSQAELGFSLIATAGVPQTTGTATLADDR
jgi:hypothetical protein